MPRTPPDANWLVIAMLTSVSQPLHGGLCRWYVECGAGSLERVVVGQHRSRDATSYMYLPTSTRNYLTAILFPFCIYIKSEWMSRRTTGWRMHTWTLYRMRHSSTPLWPLFQFRCYIFVFINFTMIIVIIIIRYGRVADVGAGIAASGRR